MFPRTKNSRFIVETCVLLVREFDSADKKVALKVNLEGISLEQGTYTPDEKPTYSNIRRYIKEKYGLDVSTLYIGQIKDKAGIKERENYNHGSCTGRVPKCPLEKEKAIMDAFKHFNMV